MISQDNLAQGSAFTNYPDDEPKGFGKNRRGRKKKGKSAPSQTPLLPYDFDAAVYLDINTDVADAGIDAAVHYVYQGIAEGRAYQWPEDMPDTEKAKVRAKARKAQA